MPFTLTDEQKSTIDSAIAHLIDLPREAKALTIEVAKLKLALEEKPLAPDDDYAMLQKCYLNPTACFNRLEHINPDVSVGHVKEYLLHFITEQIDEATIFADTTLSALEWSYPKLVTQINGNDFATRYVSEHLTFDVGEVVGQAPVDTQIPVDKEKIFTAEFIHRWEFRQLDVLITVNLPGWPLIQGESIEFPNHITTEEDEDNFIRAQRLVATKQAEEMVIDAALHYLVATKVITLGEKTRASRGARKLLVYRFYFEALTKKLIDFDEISHLDIYQAEKIAHGSIRALISADKCDLELAKNLTTSEYDVIVNPYYCNELLHNDMQIEALLGITKNQSKNLILPPVIYLLRHQKITLAQAKSLKMDARPALKNEFFIDLIMRDKVSIRDTKQLTHDQAVVLSKSFYCTEILNNRLKLDDIKIASKEPCINLALPSLILLQQKSIISLNDAKFVSPDARPIFEEEIYTNLILQGKILFADLKDLDRYETGILLMPKIMQLIEAGVLTVKEAVELNGREREIITKDTIFNLLIAKRVLFSEARRLSFGLANLLEKNIVLHGVIHQNVLRIPDLMSVITQNDFLLHPLTPWGLTFGSRLIGIYKSTPYRHENQIDSLELIKRDIEQVAEHSHLFSKSILLNQAIKVFVRYLQRTIQNELEVSQGLRNEYVDFLASLSAVETEHEELRTLCRMTETAKQKLDHLQTRMNFSLFHPNNPNTARIDYFYRKTCQVIALIEPELIHMPRNLSI